MRALNPERIVLVERPNGRDMLKRALEHVGFEVAVADTGEQALLVVATRRPAVVISDIDLPIMNGWQLAEALRTKYRPHTPRGPDLARHARRSLA